MKPNSTNWDILTRKLSGETFPLEDQWMEEWLLDKDNAELYQTIDHIQLDFNQEAAIQVKDQVFRDTFNKVFSSQGQKLQNSSRKIYFLSVAVGLALLVSIASGYFVYKNTRPEFPLVVLSCPSGLSTIVLPDSSVVTLNAGSILKYPADFDKKSRRVSLEGEAFFDVKKDRSRPFVVTTGSMDFKVLGTTFDISAYPHDEEIAASLLSGSIELNDKQNNRSLVLHPNQGVIFNKKTAEMQLKTIDPEYITGWMEGDLLFKKLSFSTICRMLERKFGQTIEIRNTRLEDKIFTGKFVNNESLTQILEIIKINMDFSYKIKGDKVVIY